VIELLTLDQVAQAMQVSRRTVERLIGSGQIRPVKVGRQTRVTPSEYDAFISASKVRR
jgi:excisionase family DNA binding protein